MAQQEYWVNRKKQLNQDLVGLRESLAELAPSVQGWDKFNVQATKELGSAHESFRSSVRWAMVRKLIFRHGTKMWDVSARFAQRLESSSKFRLLAHVGETADGQCSVMSLPRLDSGTKNGSERFPLKASARHTGEAVLALDYPDSENLNRVAVGVGICYPDGVAWMQKLSYRSPDGTKEMLNDIIEGCLKEANGKLQPLRYQYGILANTHMRYLRLKEQVRLTEANIALADKAAAIWSKIHLPEDQLTDLFEMMQAFENPNHAPGALLLKGSPGTGKTMCAVNIAKTIGGKFISAGINNIKKSYNGQSAEAVAALWKEARANKPAVIFVDECDSLFPKRGSSNSDTTTAEITNAFLSEWTGKEQGIWLIACTNRRDILDDAILSRISSEIEFQLPDEKARVAILTQELAAAGYQGQVPSSIGGMTQGMTGRDLEKLARKAALKPVADFPALVGQARGAGNPTVDSSASWETLVLPEATLANIKTTCAMLQDVESWRSQGATVSNGILLEGPPGTGKTQIARTIANEVGLSFIKATSADIRGLYLGHSSGNVKDLFEKARSMAPSILFIDELDMVSPARGTDIDSFSKEIIGQLLQEMDGIKSNSSHVFVLAATNDPDGIDSAVLSRFTERLAIPLPDRENRERLLGIMLGQAKAQSTAADLAILAEHSEGMSGRDIKNWVANAQKAAVSRAVADGGAKFYQLTVVDMLATASECRVQGSSKTTAVRNTY
jgi:SpoVK/Ycf46/Vps4 family AAA+-type ATPase